MQLELSEGHENWHEGGDEHCQQNDIFCFCIARSARISARSVQIHSFSWFWGEKLQLELSEGHENWHEGGDCRSGEGAFPMKRNLPI